MPTFLQVGISGLRRQSCLALFALAGASAGWLGASALIIAVALITIFAGFMAWALLRLRPVQETAPASI